MTQHTGEHQTHQPKGKMSTMQRVLVIVGATVFIAAVAAAVFFFLQYNALKSDPSSASQEKTTHITEKVGKIYALPNEEPTIADITDKDKLKDQTFFKDAENKDYLLIFPKAKLAIIYRESTNKLINVGPIALDDKSSKQEGTTESKAK